MLDIKFIRENKEKVKEAIQNKNIDLDLEKLLDLDQKRLAFLQGIEELQALKNDLNDLMRQAKDSAESPVSVSPLV